MSDRAIAEMCVVDHKTVAAARRELEVGNFPTIQQEAPAVRIGRDGVKQPATKPKKPLAEVVTIAAGPHGARGVHYYRRP